MHARRSSLVLALLLAASISACSATKPVPTPTAPTPTVTALAILEGTVTVGGGAAGGTQLAANGGVRLEGSNPANTFRVTTDAKGHYTSRIPADTYTVSAVSQAMCTRASVYVASNSRTTRDIQCSIR
jgi:hypothetical protein